MIRIVIFSDQNADSAARASLLQNEFEVTHVHQLESLVAVLDTWHPHVLIYSEPKPNLEAIMRALKDRQDPTAPLGWIVISPAYNMRDEIKAFSHGADHYLLQTTPLESLIARIHALAAKIQGRTHTEGPSVIALPRTKSHLRFGALQLDVQSRSLKVKGEIRPITPTQFRLLELFFSNVDQPLPREKIQSHVFNRRTMSLRSIDAHISKLKAAVPELRHAIVNLYGNGYLLKKPDTRAA